MLGRLARLCLRWPRRVLVGGALLAAVALALGGSAVERLHPYSATDPASESARANERVHELIGLNPEVGLVALVETKRPVLTTASRARVRHIADRIFRDPAVALVTTYWSQRDPAMISRDGHSTFVIAFFGTLSERDQQLSAERIRERLGDEPGVSFGGIAAANVDVVETVTGDIARAQLIALPLLLLLGFWFFRGLVAAALPVGVGALAVALSLLGLRIANAVVPISVFALNLVLGLALALAVDYSLLIVSRYREEIARHGPGEEALVRTMSTAGRTVLYSAIVICTSLSALLVFPQRFLYSMGLGGALIALAAGASSLLILPAALALLGDRVNGLSPARLQRTAAREARPATSGGWYRVSRAVMRRPAIVASLSAALLIALGLPFLHSRFIPVDVGVLPAGAESRQVREELRERFPPNLTLPLFVVIDRPAESPAVGDYARAVRALPGASRVDPPAPLDERNSLIRISPASEPLGGGSERLVRSIRAIPAPFDALLGGAGADFVDQRDDISSQLPLVLALLCAMTMVVIFLMTRSLVLPVKAVAMSLLSLCAAFGVLVFVFQEGRLESLLAYQSTGGLELSIALVLLAVGFGVSTDYGVIVLSRIKEAHDAGAPNREAIPLGLERSGRIVTAAALLPCVALGALATSQIAFIKELGIGVALAVLIDATIVRAALMPALMALLGSWNWWAPAWLRRLLREEP